MDARFSYDQEELKALLAAVLSRAPGEREQFLHDVRSRQPQYAVELKRLLAAEEKCFLAETIASNHPEPSNLGSDSATGRRVGAYELVRELGRGGMAAVFLARRADGAYDNHVAVKLIDPTLAGGSTEARFRREWRIQASLEHPNIVRLLDVGTSEGLLYLVMEYVEGTPIDEYCREHQLSLRDRLLVLRSVCDGLSYAHARLVIHRDIKPSNILVSSRGVPKLIDFGISAIAGESLACSESFTNQRLTPRYASPEQVAGDEWITTASDVYSLGVVLYELLTDRSPYAGDGRTPAAPIWAAIMHGAITPPRSCRPEIDRDLNAILLTALHLEPERRYGSVEQLAADLDRYLSGQPVAARSKAAWYRATKFTRRNWKSLATASLVAGSLCYLTLSTQRHAERAERRYHEVRGLAKSVLSEVVERVWAMPGGVQTVRYIADNQVRYIESLLRDAPSDHGLRRDLFSSLLLLGTAQGYPAAENLGDIPAADATFARALEVAEQAAVSTGTAADHVNLSHALNYRGVMQAYRGDLEGAAHSYSRAIEINRAWEEKDDGRGLILALSFSRLGEVRARQRRTAEALGLHTRAIAIRRRALSYHPESLKERRGLSLTLEYCGRSLSELGLHRPAAAAFAEMLALEETTLKSEPNSVETRLYTAGARSRLAIQEWALGNRSGLARLQHAVTDLKQLRDSEPIGVRIRRRLIEALDNLAQVQRCAGLTGSAIETSMERRTEAAELLQLTNGQQEGAVDPSASIPCISPPDEPKRGSSRSRTVQRGPIS